MSTTMNRKAYQALIDENLAWLEQQPRTLEREHIRRIVSWSLTREYGDDSGESELTFLRFRLAAVTTKLREIDEAMSKESNCQHDDVRELLAVAEGDA
jgi:hypothetical protein